MAQFENGQTSDRGVNDEYVSLLIFTEQQKLSCLGKPGVNKTMSASSRLENVSTARNGYTIRHSS